MRSSRLRALALPLLVASLAVVMPAGPARARGGYTRYVYLTDVFRLPNGGSVWFMSFGSFQGRVHTNGILRFAGNPAFSDTVSSVDEYAWFYNKGTPKHLADDHNGTIDVPVFERGFVRGAAPVPLPADSYVQQAATLGLPADGTVPTHGVIRAQLGLPAGTTPPPDGIYLVTGGSAVAGGIYVQGNADRILLKAEPGMAQQVWEIVQGPGVKTLVIDPAANTTSMTSGTTTTVYSGTPRGLVYVNGAVLDLRGPDRAIDQAPPALLDGQQLLVAATGDIVIQRDLTVDNFENGSAVLGILSSGGSVRVGASAPNDLLLDAFVMATGDSGAFMVDGFSAGTPRGTIHLRGGSVARCAGASGTFNSDGTLNSGYARDQRHDDRGWSPPWYPALEMPLVDVASGHVGPAGLRLSVPRPHPVRGSLRLSYALARAGHVRLSLFDAFGRRVAMLVDAERAAGEHEVAWTSSNERAGIYFLALESDGARVGRRVVVLD